MRWFSWNGVPLFLLCLLALTTALAGEPLINPEFSDDYGLHFSEKREPLRVQAPRGYTRGGPALRRMAIQVGGVAFGALAEPDQALVGSTISLNYLPTRDDGSRVVVAVDGQITRPSLYDWHLAALVTLVESDDTGVVSLFGSPQDEAEEVWCSSVRAEGRRPYFVRYPDAVEGTVFGFLMFCADSLLVADVDAQGVFVAARRMRSAIAAVAGNLRTGNHVTPGADALDEPRAAGALASVERAFARHVYTSYILTDDDVVYTFSLRDGELQFDAYSERQRPCFFFVRHGRQRLWPWGYPYHVLPQEDLNQEFSRIDFRGLSPWLFEVIDQSSRWLAFFRYLRANYPEEWQIFRTQVLAAAIADGCPTPRAWIVPARPLPWWTQALHALRERR